MGAQKQGSMEKLRYRLSQMQRALGDTAPRDPQSVPPRVLQSEDAIAIHQDFTGGQSPEDIRGDIEQLIYQIAHLRDLLVNCAADHGHSNVDVDGFVRESRELSICMDLANLFKHGQYDKRRRWSGTERYLGDVDKALRITTGPRPQSIAGFTVRNDEQGCPRHVPLGDGSGEVVYTGDVFDSSGQKIGEVMEIATKAIQAWEALMQSWGITTSPPNEQKTDRT